VAGAVLLQDGVELASQLTSAEMHADADRKDMLNTVERWCWVPVEEEVTRWHRDELMMSRMIWDLAHLPHEHRTTAKEQVLAIGPLLLFDCTVLYYFLRKSTVAAKRSAICLLTSGATSAFYLESPPFY